MSDKDDLSNRKFGTNEGDIKSNYVELSRSTGESFASIAERLESDAGDRLTAAKVRNLDREFPEIGRKQEADRKKAEREAQARAEEEQARRGEGTGGNAELSAQNDELRAQATANEDAIAKLSARVDELTASGGASSGPGRKTAGAKD